MTVRLVLADDHQIVRQGLRAILATVAEFELVGEAADGAQAVRLVEDLRPDVLILDLKMPRLGGLDAARQVARKAPTTRVVVLSMYTDEAYVVEALRAGVSAYVLKGSSFSELVHAVREAVAGRRYFSPPISESVVSEYLRRASGAPLDPFHTLTSREREVLELTAEGHSSAEIARRLFISPRTVESHRANLMRKLNVRNQRELIRYAVRKQEPPSEG